MMYAFTKDLFRDREVTQKERLNLCGIVAYRSHRDARAQCSNKPSAQCLETTTEIHNADLNLDSQIDTLDLQLLGENHGAGT